MLSSKFSRVRLVLLVSGCLLLVLCLYHTTLLPFLRAALRLASDDSLETTTQRQSHQVQFRRVARLGWRHTHKPNHGHLSRVRSGTKRRVESDEVHPACSKVWKNPYRGEEGWKQFHGALEEYKLFHREQLDCLRLERKTGKPSVQCKDPVRTLSWVCNEARLCNGIGDQLAQIQMTFLLAVATERVFLLYWNPEYTSDTMQHLQPYSINWRTQHTLHINTTSGDSGRISKPRQYAQLLSRLRQNEAHISLSNPFRVPLVVAYRDAVESGEIKRALSSLGVPEILRREIREDSLPHLQGIILRYLFLFDSRVSERVESVKRRLGLFQGPYAALHLRTGFLGGKWEENGNFNQRKIWKDTSQWVDMIDCALNSTDSLLGSGTPLYLATDSYTVKQWATESYGTRVKTVNLTLEHVALKQTWLGGNSDTTMESGSAWVDFLLLAHSRVLAHGISGFSSAAGSFCSLPLAQQVCLPTLTQ